jgi:hypothetical protein
MVLTQGSTGKERMRWKGSRNWEFAFWEKYSLKLQPISYSKKGKQLNKKRRRTGYW